MTRFVVCLATTVGLSLVFPGFVSAEEFAVWEFDDGVSTWIANGQTRLNASGGVLTVVSAGADPYFSTPVAGGTGNHQVSISLRSSARGRLSLQVFYTTEASPGTSEEMSVRTELRGNSENFREVRVWFSTDSPVTSLRIDPLDRRGTVEIELISLTDEQPPAPQATPVDSIRLADGFHAELLYSVPAERMGSWVCMTPDGHGRLIVSDQYGGLYTVTPPAIGTDDEIRVESIPVEVGMAQGLLCAFDSLYVVTNSGDEAKGGLYRVTDNNGDGQFDSFERIRALQGGGEHGPHAVIVAPDKQSLLIACGNHTPPTEFSASRVPQIWGEDQLLPRMWDAGGHAAGKMAPGGWIARVSPDGSEWELVASGFRNEYDIALNPAGELFTYDADMEWDVGTPWYRPTRVNHVISGAEYGWRSGTGKWSEWYPDSFGQVVAIGPGSPTGITFGTGAAFPAKYQQALFICDWSYGVMYAVHMTADGASYAGEAERFLSAAPLPVTDVVINPADGAMYFTIGGRRTQSGLYRVTYTGDKSTAPGGVQQDKGAELRALRQQLETLHRVDANAVRTAWPYLGHDDRSIRYAARTAIEHQPVEQWAERASAEAGSADARINALLALARCGNTEHQSALLESLGGLRGQQLSERQTLDALRVLQLSFIRMGRPDADMSNAVVEQLSPLYPAKSTELNRELCRLLVYLNAEGTTAKTLALLESASSQEEQIHYALCLRCFEGTWTVEERTRYFRWFLQAASLRGGNSFSGFLKNIRLEAIDRLSEQDLESLAGILAEQPQGDQPLVDAAARPFVQDWKVDDLLHQVEAGLHGRDFENGRRMFQAAACYKCHRFAGTGGIVGPELSAVARRFNARTLLESIIEPGKVISDQYESNIFVLDSGRTVAGRVVNLNNDQLMVCENMLEPGKLTIILRSEIEETLVSKVSMMPAGLINHLTRDETLDLLAYLQSGGDPQSEQFSDGDDRMVAEFSEAGHILDPLDVVQSRVQEGKAVLLDIREQSEWDAGHLKIAKLVPLSVLRGGDVAGFVDGLPKDKPIYVHCRSGRRVLACAEMLRDSGLDIRPLSAGFDALVEAGFAPAE
jgi:putative heme-binding domain-containing protein